MEKEREIIHSSKKIKLINNDENFIILVKDNIDINLLEKYKNISTWKSTINDENWILLDLKFSKELTESFYFSLKNLIKNNDINTSLKILSDKFSKKENKDRYLKFRGDFAEALYIYRNPGAKKLYKTETADINLNGELIEVKSFVEYKRIISISLKQIRENTKKIAIPLLNDSKGLSIIDLSNKITDESFSDYLKTEYCDEEYKIIKYNEKVKFKNISSQLKEIDVPENVVEAKFLIRINK